MSISAAGVPVSMSYVISLVFIPVHPSSLLSITKVRGELYTYSRQKEHQLLEDLTAD